jgi:3-oxoadipate enol-lactonase
MAARKARAKRRHPRILPMPEIVQGDLKLYYESHGRGSPLILIRGLGSNADHWYAQVPDLSRHHRVITFDNRGIARSGDPGKPFTLRDMARDTITLLDALEIGQAHVLGLSMGGMVAQEMAIEYPQRLRGLVLVVTHCGGRRQILAADAIRQKIHRLVVLGDPDAWVEMIGTFLASLQMVHNYTDAATKHPARSNILKRQYDAAAGHDTYDRLERITAPTLVITGKEDRLVPPANSKILADRIPVSELLVIPGGGHLVLVEQPLAFNRAVIDFLRRVDSV